MPRPQPQLVAGGDIYPGRFLTLSAAADFTAVQATANSRIIGVSGLGSNYPPLTDLVSTNKHATAGQPVDIKGDGEVAQVYAGDAVTAGDRLKADTNGKAVPIATTGTTLQNYGAVALQSGAADELIWVQIFAERSLYPALA